MKEESCMRIDWDRRITTSSEKRHKRSGPSS